MKQIYIATPIIIALGFGYVAFNSINPSVALCSIIFSAIFLLIGYSASQEIEESKCIKKNNDWIIAITPKKGEPLLIGSNEKWNIDMIGKWKFTPADSGETFTVPDKKLIQAVKNQKEPTFKAKIAKEKKRLSKI